MLLRRVVPSQVHTFILFPLLSFSLSALLTYWLLGRLIVNRPRRHPKDFLVYFRYLLLGPLEVAYVIMFVLACPEPSSAPGNSGYLVWHSALRLIDAYQIVHYPAMSFTVLFGILTIFVWLITLRSLYKFVFSLARDLPYYSRRLILVLCFGALCELPNLTPARLYLAQAYCDLALLVITLLLLVCSAFYVDRAPRFSAVTRLRFTYFYIANRLGFVDWLVSLRLLHVSYSAIFALLIPSICAIFLSIATAAPHFGLVGNDLICWIGPEPVTGAWSLLYFNGGFEEVPAALSSMVIYNYAIQLTKAVVVVLSCFTILFSQSHVLRSNFILLEFSVFIALASFFLLIFISSADFMICFIALESATLLVMTLIASRFSASSMESAVKYSCFAGLAAGCFFYSASFVYAATTVSTSFDAFTLFLFDLGSLPYRHGIYNTHIKIGMSIDMGYNEIFGGCQGLYPMYRAALIADDFYCIDEISGHFVKYHTGYVDRSHFREPELENSLFTYVVSGQAGHGPAYSAVGILAVTGILLGFLFKLGAFPFNFWVPDVYEGAPLPILFFVLSAFKLAVTFVLTRLIFSVFAPVSLVLHKLILVSSGGSFIFGALGALSQRSFKRFLAYASINQVGFILLAITCLEPHYAGAGVPLLGASSVYFFIYSYLCNTVVLFYCIFRVAPTATSLTSQSGSVRFNSFGRGGVAIKNLFDLKNLARYDFLTSAWLTAALASSAGIPPFLGFFGKLSVIMAAVDAGHLGLTLVALATGVISSFYYCRLIRLI